MKKYTLIIISFLLCLSSFAKDKVVKKKLRLTEEQKNAKLLTLIDKEEQLIKSMRRLGPRLRWRLVEINSEKLKIVKKRENALFLAGSINNPQIKKSAYFKKSKALERSIYKDGLKIIKTWKDFRHVSDIYYTMALNNRDFGNRKKVERLLLKAKRTASDKRLTHKIRVALAEHYYNNKKYKKAISYYSTAVKNIKDPWISKHLYNYSWCLTKVQRYDEAISHGKLALNLGRKDGFVSVADQIFTNMGLFHILARKTSEGADFYLEELNDPTPYLVKMAKKTASDVSFASAHSIYKKALKNTQSKKLNDSTMLLHLEELDFYRGFKKDSLFWETSLALEKHSLTYKMKEDHRERAVKTIKSFTNYLQTHFRNSIERFAKEDIQYQHIIRYMDILITLDKMNSDYYHFYQAEVHLALEMNKEALSYYKKALVASQTVKKENSEYKKHMTHRKNIFDSLFYALDSDNVPKTVKDDYTKYSYNEHIKLYPKDPRTFEIFPKLFHFYFSKKDISSSHKTLARFTKSFPKGKKVQRELNTRIIDHYITKKNIDSLMPEIVKIESGYLSYDKKYIKSALLILSNLIFKKYETMAKTGKESQAIAGYESLYEDEKTPRSLKGHAAFKLSELNISLNKNELSFKWLERSYPLLPKEDIHKISTHIKDLSSNLFLKQDFYWSSEFNRSYLIRQCSKSHPNKNDMFSLWATTKIMEQKTGDAIKVVRTMKKCKVSDKTYRQSLTALLEHISNYHTTNTLLSFYKTFRKDKKLHPLIITELKRQYWRHFSSGNKKSTNSILALADKYKLDDFSGIKKFDRTYTKALNVKFKPMSQFNKVTMFPEDRFNTTLEANMKALQNLKDILSPYFKSNDAHMAANSFNVLSNHLNSFISEVEIISPLGFGKDYNLGFRKAMRQITRNFSREQSNLVATLNKTVKASRVLPRHIKPQSNLVYGSTPSATLSYRHPASLFTVPVDRRAR